jgi:hypothetical protein
VSDDIETRVSALEQSALGAAVGINQVKAATEVHTAAVHALTGDLKTLVQAIAGLADVHGKLSALAVAVDANGTAASALAMEVRSLIGRFDPVAKNAREAASEAASARASADASSTAAKATGEALQVLADRFTDQTAKILTAAKATDESLGRVAAAAEKTARQVTETPAAVDRLVEAERETVTVLRRVAAALPSGQNT